MTKALKIAIINEHWTAGATRCARDLEHYLSSSHVTRYYPRNAEETPISLQIDLDSFKPDIVHLHSYYSWLPYKFLAKISSQYPSCFTVHDPRPIGTIHYVCWNCPQAAWCVRCFFVGRFRKALLINPYFWRRLYKRYVHQCTKRSLTVIAPSRWMQCRLAATECSRFTLAQIPYGIDVQYFQPIHDARVRLGLPQHAKVILFVAHADVTWRVNPRKGLQTLAEAFTRIVLTRHPDTILYVAGEHLVPNHPNVKPLGHLSSDMLPVYYSAADVLAVPTLADNLPYTILEAMSCAVPVVASNIGGIPEEIEDGKTGYLFPPSDVVALGQALVAVLQDREKRLHMGQVARENIQKSFSMDLFTRKHAALYQAIRHPKA